MLEVMLEAMDEQARDDAGVSSETAGAAGVEGLLERAADQRRKYPGGRIVFAATPLGNPLDASIRLIDALGSADVIAAEDTRRTRALAASLGVSIHGQVISNFDHNEVQRAEQFVEMARSGKTVLLVTDAGMPAVSDPGFALVTAANEAGVPVTCLPGPSAVTTALALSGCAMGHFSFLGFVPRKEGARKDLFRQYAELPHAMCFFEAPHRLAATLASAAEVFGADRMGAVCRELTKPYEEVKRGTLGELRDWAGGGVKGEICVVIDAAGEKTEAEIGALIEDLVAVVEARVSAGERLKSAAGDVAKEHGVSKRELYQAVLNAR